MLLEVLKLNCGVQFPLFSYSSTILLLSAEQQSGHIGLLASAYNTEYKVPSSFMSHACDRQSAEFLLIEDNIENSWVPHPGFEPQPSAQQAGILLHNPKLQKVTNLELRSSSIELAFQSVLMKNIPNQRFNLHVTTSNTFGRGNL